MVVAGNSHTVVLDYEGTVWTWGGNLNSQIGDGTTVSRLTPMQGLGNVTAVAAGGTHTLALKEEGTVWGCA